MSVCRLRDIPGFNIDRVAAAAGDDPDVLRMENLDTDVPPPAAAIAATRRALGEVSRRLLEQKVAATPMPGWGGEVAARHVRFVFSNEPVERLTRLGERVRRALESARVAT